MRDPCGVSESWFRHLSQVYESIEGKSFPFGQSNFKAFCPGTFHAFNFEKGEEYERFLAMAGLEYGKLPNIQLVFYEDLVMRPEIVVRSIATFLELDQSEDLMNAIALKLQREYKDEGLRLEPVFSDEFLTFMETRWMDQVKYTRGPNQPIENYYQLFEILTGRPYPYPRFESSAVAQRKSTGGSSQISRRVSKRFSTLFWKVPT
jgi:hypothetical protein